jgi:hypothetical protein
MILLIGCCSTPSDGLSSSRLRSINGSSITHVRQNRTQKRTRYRIRPRTLAGVDHSQIENTTSLPLKRIIWGNFTFNSPSAPLTTQTVTIKHYNLHPKILYQTPKPPFTSIPLDHITKLTTMIRMNRDTSTFRSVRPVLSYGRTSTKTPTTERPSSELPSYAQFHAQALTQYVDGKGGSSETKETENIGNLVKTTSSALMCGHQGSTLFQLPKAGMSPFCRSPPDIFTRWSPHKANIYSRITRPRGITNAFACVTKREDIVYYTNLWGDKFKTGNLTVMQTSVEACKQMVKFRNCRQGHLTPCSENRICTHNVVKLDFPGNIESLWKGREPTMHRTA